MTAIEIDPTLKAQLDQLAADQHRSPTALIHDAVADYIARAQAREAAHRDADTAWSDFQKTGVHLTGDELDAWLAGWGTDSETSPPVCHT